MSQCVKKKGDGAEDHVIKFIEILSKLQNTTNQVG